jgi:hypothetical protein
MRANGKEVGRWRKVADGNDVLDDIKSANSRPLIEDDEY